LRPILKPVYVLIHSPLVGPLTWTLVANELRQRGSTVLLPSLHNSPEQKQPYWQQHASSVAQAFTKVPKSLPLILVAHSGAGPLLPAIRQLLPNSIHAYVFVDAGIPRDGATRLDLMRYEDADWADQFEKELERGERFPTWSFDDLQEAMPDENIRRQMVPELRPRNLDFFTEPIPVFAGWPDAPCIYIQLSASYDWDAAQARLANWPTYNVEAGHFHMLVDARQVAELIAESVTKIQP
jgi:hypothetical protein